MTKSIKLKDWKLIAFSFLMGVLFMFASTVSSRVQAQELAYDAREYEDLVLAVALDREVISPGIFALEKEGEYYLPVNELARVYGIFSKAEDGKLAGFIFNEENKFLIDAEQSKVFVNGEEKNIPDGAFLDAGENDVYMKIDVFSLIWPVDLSVRKSALILDTEPNGDLPFNLLRNREKRKSALLTKVAENDDEEVYRPFLAYPYQLYSKPTLSISGNANYRRDNSVATASVNVSGTQDLLYSQADYTTSLSYGKDGVRKPESIRLRFTRQNIHENALPLGLEEVRWGDVGLRNRGLIGSGTSGRGVVFTNERNDFSKDFDLITVDGVATPGWETELYVNGELIVFGEVASDGLYSFEDVAVNYGKNDIRVVLYGPQGQIVERRESYSYKTNSVKAGERFFTGGLIDQNERLIPIDVNDDFEAKGLAANVYGAQGVTDNLTVFASASIFNDLVSRESIQEKYLTAGAIASFDNLAVQSEVYKELDGGAAIDTRALTSFKGIQIAAQASLFKDFESRSAGRGESAKKFEFDFNMRKTISTVIGAIGLQAGVNYVETNAGDYRVSYDTRQSYGVNRLRFTNTLRSIASNGDLQSTQGTFATSTNLNKINLRNTLSYRLYPDNELTATDLSLSYRYKDNYSLSLGAQRNFITDTTTASFLLSKEFEKFTGSTGVTWSSESGPAFSLRANTTLAPFGKDGKYVASPSGLKGSGPIAAFTFRDLDYDGIYSEGDEPIAGSKVVINDKLNRYDTGKNGFMYDATTTNNRLVSVQAQAESIDDPYLVPSNPGYNVYPRPGVIHRIALPLVETGAIDGAVRYTDGRAVAGLDLELMDIDGEIVKKSTTAPDGYFTFEQVMPGNYTIRAAPETGATIPFKYVDLTPDDLFRFGEDIIVVDLTGENATGLNIAINDLGQMNVKNILTLAKKTKSKDSTSFKDYNRPKPEGKKTVPAPQALGIDDSLTNKILNLSPAAGGDASSQLPAVIEPISTTNQVVKGERFTSASNVTSVRIGQHPGKERIVLDLTNKTKYVLGYDETQNAIVVDMPHASWSANKNWQASKAKSIVSNYKIEQADEGVRMILAVADGAKIGKSGLLNADHGKKDRLYIDITR